MMMAFMGTRLVGGYCPMCDTIWAPPGKCKCPEAPDVATVALTMAERFRAQRQPDYTDARQFFCFVTDVDKNAVCATRNGRVVIMFSDGSEYMLGNNA